MSGGANAWPGRGACGLLLVGIAVFAGPVPGAPGEPSRNPLHVPGASPPLQVPVAGVSVASLVDSFDDDRGGRRHEAIDIPAPRGTPVVAAGDGKVVKLFLSKPGGMTVYQFNPSGTLAYYYAHLERYAPRLSEGQNLRRGDPVGYVGSTGNAHPDAPHLHFAVFELGPGREWWKGAPINPLPLFRGDPASPPPSAEPPPQVDDSRDMPSP